MTLKKKKGGGDKKQERERQRWRERVTETATESTLSHICLFTDLLKDTYTKKGKHISFLYSITILPPLTFQKTFNQLQLRLV